MILELWDYLTTPSSKEARKEGYLYKSIALEQRCKRNLKIWQTHVENCHRHVRAAVKDLKEKDILCVLGSGLLVEIPLEDLVQQFNKIYLFDIVHLKSVRKKIRPYKGKVELVEINFLNPSWLQEVSKKNPSLTISANLLSQLPDLFIQKRVKENPAITDHELLFEAREILHTHLKQVCGLKGSKIMFTDDLRWNEDKDGEKLEIVPTLLEISLPVPRAQWEWTLAPRPEMHRDQDVKMRVKFFRLG